MRKQNYHKIQIEGKRKDKEFLKFNNLKTLIAALSLHISPNERGARNNYQNMSNWHLPVKADTQLMSGQTHTQASQYRCKIAVPELVIYYQLQQKKKDIKKDHEQF